MMTTIERLEKKGWRKLNMSFDGYEVYGDGWIRRIIYDPMTDTCMALYRAEDNRKYRFFRLIDENLLCALLDEK